MSHSAEPGPHPGSGHRRRPARRPGAEDLREGGPTRHTGDGGGGVPGVAGVEDELPVPATVGRDGGAQGYWSSALTSVAVTVTSSPPRTRVMVT